MAQRHRLAALAQPDRKRVADAVMISACVLLGTALFQAPLLDLTVVGDAGLLVRAWDVAWAAFAVVAVVGIGARIAAEGRRLTLPRRRTPIVLFALLALTGLLSLAPSVVTFGSDGLLEAVIRVGRFASAALLGLLAWWYLDERRRSVVVGAFAVVAAIAGVMAFAAWQNEKKPVYEAGRTVQYGTVRAGGPFGNFYSDARPQQWWAHRAGPNNYGFWAAIALTTGTGILVAGGRWRRRRRALALAIVVMASAVAGLLATHSRESLIAAVAGCIGIVLLSPSPSRRVKIGLGLAIPLAALVLVASTPSLRERTVDSFVPGTFAYTTGPEARFSAWKGGLEFGFERFPVGWGIGAMDEHPNSFGRSSPENMFLQAFVELGLLGPLLLLGICLYGIRQSVEALRANPAGLSPKFACAVFLVLSIHGTFGNTLGDPSNQIVIACALAFCSAAPRLARSSTELAAGGDTPTRSRAP
jgi:hypothetical protein